MSHELRTPLNSVLALSGLMITRGPGKNIVTDVEHLKIIQKNGQHLLNLINDILDISKIESGKTDVNLSSFNPLIIVNEALSIIRPLAENKKLKVNLFLEDNITMYSDMEKLKQILLNLLSNAVKFTNSGFITITIKKNEDSISFIVEDSGIGIEFDDQEKIFDEFRQVDSTNTRRYEGTGLGLAISQRLAKVLNGIICLESEPGNGSKFNLTAPLFMSKSPDIQEVPISKNEIPRETKKTILVVDDEYKSRNIICNNLKDLGYVVMQANNGIEALKITKKVKPFAITMDLYMPGISGFEVLEIIRSSNTGMDIPVIIMASKTLSVEEEQILKKSTNSFLIKDGLDEIKLKNKLLKLLQDIEVNNPQQFLDGTILVVEDNRDNIVTISAILDDINSKYVIATDGFEAIEKANKVIPQLILMDIHLPGMSGIDATKKIRENPILKDIPIVALTAKAMKGDREEFLKSGFNDYMSKPLDPQKLQKLVRSWINR